MNHQVSRTSSGASAVDGGPIAALGGIALVVNLVGLYAFTGVALCVFGYVATTLILSSQAQRSARNIDRAEAGSAVLVASWAAALVGGVLVGALHWVKYAHAAWAVLALYGCAVLVWNIGQAFSAFWSWLFPALGIAMVAAVVQLGAPPGSRDLEKQENWTPVVVTVVDEAGVPIHGATVYLDLVSPWSSDPDLEGDREWWSKDTTQADGTARMALHEDPRFKRLVIRVRREPGANAFNEPMTIGAYVGFEDVRHAAYLPTDRAVYSFETVMHRRPHPDSAFLCIDLPSPPRSLKLVLAPGFDLRGREDLSPDSIDGLVREADAGGPHSLVFKLDHRLAGQPLMLCVFEVGSMQSSESIRELRRMEIEPIDLGTERVLTGLSLPERAADRSIEGRSADQF